MLLIVSPFASEDAPVGVGYLPCALLLVRLEVAFVHASISPEILTRPIDHIILPLTFVLIFASPDAVTIASDLVVLKLALVLCSIFPCELALAMFLTLHVASLISAVVVPRLDAEAMLQVVLPLPLVNRALVRLEDTVAISSIIEPFTLIYITIFVDETTNAISLAECKLTFVQGAIIPDKSALTCSHEQFRAPLARIDRPIDHPKGLLCDELDWSWDLNGRFLQCFEVKRSLLHPNLIYKFVMEEALSVSRRIKVAFHLT